ncbi:MAG: hypothetical protein ABI863_00540 [Ginsengibacter sp.]
MNIKNFRTILIVLLMSIAQFTSAQNVGIGTSTPVSKLEVRDGALTITNTLTAATLVINRAKNSFLTYEKINY